MQQKEITRKLLKIFEGINIDFKKPYDNKIL